MRSFKNVWLRTRRQQLCIACDKGHWKSNVQYVKTQTNNDQSARTRETWRYFRSHVRLEMPVRQTTQMTMKSSAATTKTATATTRSAITLRTPKQCTENVFEARRCYLREIYATTINLRLVDIQQPIYRRSLAGTLSNRPLYIERRGFDHPAQPAGALLCR